VARPDGNTTGVNFLDNEVNGKRQDILIESVPGLRRMAALADVTTDAPLGSLREGAQAHNVELSIYHIAKGEEIAGAIDTAHASGATALNVLASMLFYTPRQLIMDRVAALHLPTIYVSPIDVCYGLSECRLMACCKISLHWLLALKFPPPRGLISLERIGTVRLNGCGVHFRKDGGLTP
jgi:hypothetical protein